ncbi:MAG: hypothetical protein O7J95_08030 [Planctomycetota bacterium]|nr:hypothetical protein [Planctomycetota bacterium]
MDCGPVPDADPPEDPPVDRAERDAESIEADSTTRRGHHLFDDVVVGSPLEELQEVQRKAVRGVRDDPDAAERVVRAYQIAREHLLAQLGEQAGTCNGSTQPSSESPSESRDEDSPC